MGLPALDGEQIQEASHVIRSHSACVYLRVCFVLIM